MTTQNTSPLLTTTRLAFQLADDAHAFQGSATQAMAWVLRTLHTDFVRDGMRIPGKNGEASQVMPCATWAMIHKGGEARQLFVSAVKHSLGVFQTGAAKDETYKAKAARETNNNTEKRHAALIGKAIPFAAALEARGVPMDGYSQTKINNRVLPVWRVPVSMLAMPGWTLLGDEAMNPNLLRALDGKAVLAQAKNKDGDWRPVQNAVASVDQFKRALFGDAKKGENPAPQTPAVLQPVKLDNGKEIPADFNKLVQAAGTMISEITDKGAATVRLSDFDETTRNALTALYLFYNEAVQADAAAKPGADA